MPVTPTDPVSDVELVQLSRSGDAGAYGQLVARYQNLVRAVALGTTGDLAASEEHAQEAFITAWTRLDELREPAHFSSWVCGIARNQARYSRRHERRHAPAGTESMERLEGVPTGAPSPLDMAIERQQRQVMGKALRCIPDSYREPLVLFYGHNRSVAEVARCLGISRDTVKQRLSRGRKYLERGVHEMLQHALARSAGICAAVLATIALMPRAQAAGATAPVVATGASKGLLGSAATAFMASAKVATGGLLVAATTLLMLSSHSTSAPSAPAASPQATAPVTLSAMASAVPSTAETIRASAVIATPAPVVTASAAPDVLAPRRVGQRTAPIVRERAMSRESVHDHGMQRRAIAPVLLEQGPSQVSRSLGEPAVSLLDALVAASLEEPVATAPRRVGLPIEPPDFVARITTLDI